jgi:glycosyltransferase involved in cell wall biosynthesis
VRVALLLGTSTGGVGQHVRSLADRLPASGVDVTVVGPAGTDALFGFSATGARFVAVPVPAVPRPSDVRTVRALRRLLPGFDLVHAHGLRAAAFAGLALGRRRPGRTPVVSTWHNAVLARGPQRQLLAGLERLAARRADLTLGASSDLVDRARSLGAPAARLGPVAAPPLVPPGESPAEVRQRLGCLDRALVVAVGRLAPQKDYPVLLAAAADWRDGGPPLRVVIAGDGPLRAEIQGRVDAERLPVLLLGRVDDVAALFAAADVAVLTSRWEARALVAQEALRAGTPLVATAVGGVPELVGDAAVLVPPGDSAGVARHVRRLLADAAERDRLAVLGRARAATWPDEDGTAQDVLAAYRQVAARSDRGRPGRAV